ncbi:DUF6950 family protein [Psychromarinibacter halotolerans]|uniref:DUF6950 family protein n=1 Tax=Psychromarinibacter halotolerans TaxID=1775175 RepID=A0ABV7GY62_9RHOB|nr:hypothetical protein [Psychromarinibacter halotolerans]
MSPLFQEVNRWHGLPTVWGRSDCMLVVADWVERVTGRDFAADLRNRYYDEASAERVCGWVTAPVECVASRVGDDLPRIAVEDRLPGDIAVLSFAGEDGGRGHSTGAVWLGRSWVCKGVRRGAVELRHSMLEAQVLAAWRVPYGGAERGDA